MALITGTLAIAANTSSNLTLNRVELEGLISDTYFGNKDNWKKVVVRYTYLAQFVDVIFDGQTGVGKCYLPAKVLNGVFKIHSIRVVDFMNGDYYMTQGQVPSLISYNITASGGVDYTIGGGGGNTTGIVWDNLATGMATTGNGELHNAGPDLGWGNNAYSASGMVSGSGDFSFQWNMSLASAPSEFSVGIKNSLPNNAQTGYDSNTYGLYRSGALNKFFVSVGSSYISVDLGVNTNLTPVIKIARESGDLKFYIDGVLKHTVPSYADTTIYPKASLYCGSNSPSLEASILSTVRTVA